MTVILLVIFVLSLSCAFVLTRSVRDFASRRGWVAAPSNERHLHSRPLPRLGGVAIYLSFAASVAVAYGIASRDNDLAAALVSKRLFTILLPATAVFLLGVYDDVRGVGPYVKFAVQGIAASMLFAGGLRIVNIPVLLGQHNLPWIAGLACTIVWVVAITNAFNLIDGLDGLAAGSALFSTMVAFVVSLLSGHLLVTLLSVALAGAILGFLRFNFNPATIFLGDSGSLFIGFLLSALALEGTQKAPTIVAVAIPVVSFGLPILETSLSIVRRFISGRPVFVADREHIHHKLLQHGLTHRQVVILLYGVSAMFALLSLFLLWPGGSSLGLVLAVLGIGVWIGVQHLGYLEFGELARVAQRTLDQRQIFINNLSIRRAIEELKVAHDFQQVRNILLAAFGGNEFDGFEMNIRLFAGEALAGCARGSDVSMQWTKIGTATLLDGLALWTLNLDLLSSSNRRRGSVAVHRLYGRPDLQLDINLLTAAFPLALADALDRVLPAAAQVMALPDHESEFIAAQAG